MTAIAYFVTDHGFGHATRAAAVMAAVAAREPSVRFEVFTTAPAWLFEGPLRFRRRHHRLPVDVGPVQRSPFETDLAATAAALGRWLPLDGRLVDSAARGLRQLGCRLAVCDIAPLGIAAAAAAGIPSVLVENFTWDWIYGGYRERCPQLEAPIACLAGVYAAAGTRIQVTPVCRPVAGARRTGPVSRPLHDPPEVLRRRLGVNGSRPLVAVSLGGLAGPQDYARLLPDAPGVTFLIPGAVASPERCGHLLRVPARGLYHPDLVNAADAVIGKLGYGTLAEAYQAGTPFGYLPREDFRESAVLAAFARQRMASIEIRPADVENGTWCRSLEALLRMPRAVSPGPNGADQVARLLLQAL